MSCMFKFFKQRVNLWFQKKKKKQYKFYSLSFTKRAAQTIITIDKNRLVNINYRIMNLHCCYFSNRMLTCTFSTATKLIIKYYFRWNNDE